MEETRKPARKPRATAAPKPAARKVAATASPPTRKVVKRASPRPASPKPVGPSPAEREQRVRTAAYFRAQRRGFAPGYEWEDWLAAEAEVSAGMDAGPASSPRKAPARKAKSG